MKTKEMINEILAASGESAAVLDAGVARLAPGIARAARMMAAALTGGGKVLACGNGGSAADAQHLAGELVGRFLKERAPYPAVALSTDTSVVTSLANDYGFETVFERQVIALGGKRDVLVAISTSGNSPNVIRAMKAAAKKGMKVIALTGKGGGKMAGSADVLLDAESKLTPRIQETHGFIIHALCGLVEKILTEED